MKKRILLFAVFACLMQAASAGGIMRTGGFLPVRPDDFTTRFNTLRNNMPQLFPAIRLDTAKRSELKTLGNGITLLVRKNRYGDFENIEVRCSGLHIGKRLQPCMLALVFAAMSADDQIREKDFLRRIETAVDKGSALYNEAGIDYALKADTQKKTMRLTIRPDSAETVEEMDQPAASDSGLTDTLVVVPCDPKRDRCK